MSACSQKARWYAVARGADTEQVTHRYGLNLSTCDGHRWMTPLELAAVARWDGVEDLRERMPRSLEIVWEHIGGT